MSIASGFCGVLNSAYTLVSLYNLYYLLHMFTLLSMLLQGGCLTPYMVKLSTLVQTLVYLV